MIVDQPPPLREASLDRWAQRAVLVFTLAIRIGAAEVAGNQLCRHDVDNYLQLAENVVQEGVYSYADYDFGELAGSPTARRPPLYPLLLVACMYVVQPVPPRDWPLLGEGGIALLHIALGVLTVWLVVRLARNWGLGRWSYLAGVLVACDPILVRQATLIMTETLAALVSVLALVALTAATSRPTSGNALWAGVTLGLTVLCRPTFLVWALVALAALSWLWPLPARRCRSLLVSIIAFCAVLAPWAIRNAIDFGRPIVTTTHGGFTLLLGNNQEYYAHLRVAPRRPWDATNVNEKSGRARSRALAIAARDNDPASTLEIDQDAAEYRAAWECIRNEPGMFLLASAFRVSRFWGVLPLALPGQGTREDIVRYATALVYLVEFALAAWGMLCLGRRLVTTPWLFGLLLAASFTLVHALYWTDLRMRAPVMPVVALAAAAGVGCLVARSKSRKS